MSQATQPTFTRMVLAGLTFSMLALFVPFEFCMEGDAHGFPWPMVYPRHGEEFMTLGWVTGEKGGGTVVDLLALPINAGIFIVLAVLLGYSYRLAARGVRFVSSSIFSG